MADKLYDPKAGVGSKPMRDKITMSKKFLRGSAKKQGFDWQVGNHWKKSATPEQIASRQAARQRIVDKWGVDVFRRAKQAANKKSARQPRG